jgi:hypothetical protein
MAVSYQMATAAAEDRLILKAVNRSDGVKGSSAICDITQPNELLPSPCVIRAVITSVPATEGRSIPSLSYRLIAAACRPAFGRFAMRNRFEPKTFMDSQRSPRLATFAPERSHILQASPDNGADK